jgi:cytochrome c biogenesis protein CcmG/thiol:disulfide interchange protein DsbE
VLVGVLVAAAVLGATTWLTGASRGGPGDATGPAAPLDDPAPALSGPTLAGGTLDLADLRGSVVLVNVWAAWCAPCRDEFPVLVGAERRLGERSLRVVGIDTRDGERQARGFLAEVRGDPASSVVDPDGEVAARWGVRGVPETFVVDADGRIVARRLGVVTEEWISEVVVPLLWRTGER